MRYHAICTYGSEKYFWWNWAKDKFVAQILLPFINGHIVRVGLRGGTALLNMNAVNEFQVFKTEETLSATDDASIADQMRADDFKKRECTDELMNEVRLLQANPQVSSLLQKCFAEVTDCVFVVMKFGDKLLDSAYEGVMRPVIEANGLRALRIDEVQDSGQITD